MLCDPSCFIRLLQIYYYFYTLSILFVIRILLIPWLSYLTIHHCQTPHFFLCMQKHALTISVFLISFNNFTISLFYPFHGLIKLPLLHCFDKHTIWIVSWKDMIKILLYMWWNRPHNYILYTIINMIVGEESGRDMTYYNNHMQG